MSKLIYGFDPHAVQNMRQAEPPTKLPTKKELLKIGIAPRKVERVQQELTRLAAQDVSLTAKPMLLKLARELEKQFI